MQGLRTQENDKFCRFLSLVQAEAERHNAVFFVEAGDGNEFVTDVLECEELMGWLIPKDRVHEFEPIWKAYKVDDDWTDYFLWAEWYLKDGEVCVRFQNYGDDIE